jgi:hypothetical protein
MHGWNNGLHTYEKQNDVMPSGTTAQPSTNHQVTKAELNYSQKVQGHPYIGGTFLVCFECI